MSGLPIVYLGPSLARSEAERLLAAEYRPPVRRGDLPARYPNGVIVIIDGEFGQSLSVSPKEILRLLEQGARVLGASSMGALRAAELYPYGMEGYGWIFEGYRSGKITGDDEVALAYSPFDQRPLTIPLVNVRCWLEQLRAAGRLDAETSRKLLRQARRIFFADRTFHRLREAFGAVADARLLEAILRREEDITDIKAADARLVLSRAAAHTTTQKGKWIHGNEESESRKEKGRREESSGQESFQPEGAGSPDHAVAGRHARDHPGIAGGHRPRHHR